MSGPRIAPFVNANKDTYITGGVVTKLAAKKRPANESSELVLCAAAVFRIVTVTAATPAVVEGDLVTQPSLTSAIFSPTPAARKRFTADASAPRPTQRWRTPLNQVLKVYSLSDWWKTATKLPRESVTSEEAPGSSVPEYGLVIEYLSDKGKPKSLAKYPTAFRPHLEALQAAHQLPQLRYRFFGLQSASEQTEWLALFDAVSCNYWQERCESSFVLEPDVYQYHAWATSAPGVLHHLVLSTTTLYIGPSAPNSPPSAWRPVAVGRIERCSLNSGAAPTLLLVAKSGSDIPPLRFFSAALAMELVVELQRIWGISRKDQPFPFS